MPTWLTDYNVTYNQTFEGHLERKRTELYRVRSLTELHYVIVQELCNLNPNVKDNSSPWIVESIEEICGKSSMDINADAKIDKVLENFNKIVDTMASLTAKLEEIEKKNGEK